MKFYIDGIEIKTVETGAVIEGNINSVSRCASFSYAYNSEDSNFEVYKAKIGSIILIRTDSNKGVFIGKVSKISYETDKKIIRIQANDMLSLLAAKKIKGRFKGILSSVIAKAAKQFNIISSIQNIIQKKVNILSFGNLSAYDVIYAACSKIFGNEFKLYIDGDGKINVLIPSILLSKGDFVIGQNISSSSFIAASGSNLSRITAIGDDKVISGAIIRVIEPESGIFGYFIVQKDTHIYGKTHTMELELEERSTLL